MKSLIPFQVPLFITLMISFTAVCSQTDEWISITELSNGIGLCASVVLDNKIYIIGGHAAFLADAVKEVIAYDPVADSFILDIANLPVGRGSVAAEVLNGKIYVVGGQEAYGGGGMQPSVYAYDPQSNSWTKKADMLQSRMNHSVVALNEKLVVVAGRTVDHPAPIDNTVEMYDPETDSWSSLPSKNYRSSAQIAEVVNGKLYVLGGSVSGDLFPRIEVYDPETNQWSELIEMPNRWGHGSVVLQDHIYFFGGADYVKALPDIWKYDVSSNHLVDLGVQMPDTLAYPAYGLLEDAFKKQCIYVIGGTTVDWWVGGPGPYVSTGVLKYCPENSTMSALGEAAVSELRFNVFPNPSTDERQITYELQDLSHVRIVLIDQGGRIIKTILNEVQNAGVYSFTWNSKGIASGTYYCKLNTGKFIATRKLIITHSKK